MPTKRSWWSNNFPTVIWTIVLSMGTSIFYFGSAWNAIQRLPDKEDVRRIAIESTEYRYFPLPDGVSMAANIEHIKGDIREMKGILNEINGGSRTLANKQIEDKTKKMAIIIPLPSGDSNRLIKDVDEFKLNE